MAGLLMLKSIRQYIYKQQFEPGILGLLVNPFYFARKGLFTHLVPLLSRMSGDVLDVGCGRKPYDKYCICTKYVGLEIETPENRLNKQADFYYDGSKFPFCDAEFDGIVTNQVFEHVFTPETFLNEIWRVLKPGGLLVMSVPFVWDEHEQPYDYARYSSFGLKHLLVNNGFEIMEHYKSCNDISAVIQLLNAYIYKIVFNRSNYFKIALTLAITSVINIVGLVLSKILPKNSDLYLDNIVLARKI